MRLKIQSYLLIISFCLFFWILFCKYSMAQQESTSLPELARIQYGSIDWKRISSSIQDIVDKVKSGGDMPVAAQEVLNQANLGGLGLLAALAGQSLGGGQVDPMAVAQAAQQVLNNFNYGGLALLAEQAGLTLGGSQTDWMKVAQASQQVLTDMHFGGLGQLAELAGKSMGGEQTDWMEVARASQQVFDDFNLGWIGKTVEGMSQGAGLLWSQMDSSRGAPLNEAGVSMGMKVNTESMRKDETGALDSLKNDILGNRPQGDSLSWPSQKKKE